MGPVWKPFFKKHFFQILLNSELHINVIVKCVLERYTFFFAPSALLATVNLLRHTTFIKRLRRRKDWIELTKKFLKQKKRVPTEWIFSFLNSLNKSCNDVNYYKFQCIMHTDHPVWHRSQPLNRHYFFCLLLKVNRGTNDDFQASFHIVPLMNGWEVKTVTDFTLIYLTKICWLVVC